MERARELLSRVPDASFLIERPQLFTSKSTQSEISGLDLADLGLVSDALVAMMEASGAFLDIESSWQPGYPGLQIEFDDDQSQRSITVPQVAQRVVTRFGVTYRRRLTCKTSRSIFALRSPRASVIRRVISPTWSSTLRLQCRCV